MGVNVAAQPRHIFLGSDPPGENPLEFNLELLLN